MTDTRQKTSFQPESIPIVTKFMIVQYRPTLRAKFRVGPVPLLISANQAKPSVSHGFETKSGDAKP